MNSSSKCDVEISITLDGDETVESVPEYLQDAFLCTSQNRKTDHQKPVTLPLRYAQWVNNCTDCEKERIGKTLMGDNIVDRERDLSTALKWIKQEMILMKEQDNALMKQFTNMRSRIVHLRSLYEFNSSNSDLSHDGSAFSLDEMTLNPLPLTKDYLANTDFELTEFRERTTSLLPPKGRNSGPVTRIKWKSNEYI